MKKRITEKAANFLHDYIVNSVTDVDFEYLSRQGIKACLFDLDHTILHHGTTIIQPKILEHIHESGMKVYIATNRVYSEVLDEIAVQLKADGVVHAMRGDFAKPSRADPAPRVCAAPRPSAPTAGPGRAASPRR